MAEHTTANEAYLLQFNILVSWFLQMTTWVVLFRGINVGGRNVVRMADLVQSLQATGLKDVQTYIQSGNVVCRSGHRSAEAVKKVVATAVQQEFEVVPELLILSRSQFIQAVAECPFESDDEKTIHFFFLQQSASTACESSLREVVAHNEKWRLTDRVFYLVAPDGIGKSRLAASLEKRLQVSATARNLRTVTRLVAMLDDLP